MAYYYQSYARRSPLDYTYNNYNSYNSYNSYNYTSYTTAGEWDVITYLFKAACYDFAHEFVRNCAWNASQRTFNIIGMLCAKRAQQDKQQVRTRTSSRSTQTDASETHGNGDDGKNFNNADSDDHTNTTDDDDHTNSTDDYSSPDDYEYVEDSLSAHFNSDDTNSYVTYFLAHGGAFHKVATHTNVPAVTRTGHCF